MEPTAFKAPSPELNDMFGELDALIRLYHHNPVLFILTVVAAMLFIPYQAIYGPTRSNRYGHVPRHKLPLFLGFVACEIGWVVYIVWKLGSR